MKLVTGGVLLLTAEQAYAHAQLIPFPNHESAANVLIPASLMLVWGLLTEARSISRPG